MRCEDCGEEYYTCSSIPKNEEARECEKCGGTVISLGSIKPDKDSSDE